MNRTLYRYLSIFVLLFAFVPTSAQHAGKEHPDCPPNCPHIKWGKMEANFENLRLLKLLEALDLTDEQSEKFMPLFNSFRRDTREMRQERKLLIDELIGLIDNKGDEFKIKSILDNLRQNEDRLKARREKFSQDCDAILTIYQAARLTIFQERFEREILESLREFRQHRGPRGNGKP